MTNQYTNVSLHYNKLAFRGFENGKRVSRIIDYAPSLFVPSKNPSKWHTFQEPHEIYKPANLLPVEPIKFSSIKECRTFIRQHENYENFPIFGFTRYSYAWIAENYPNTDNFVDIFNQLHIAIIDIEVGSERGFPTPEHANEEITAISVYLSSHQKYFVFGCGQYNPERSDIKYHKFEYEDELLRGFINFWSQNYPDILTGYNSTFFDIPYLFNRIRKVVGEDQAKKLSPWSMVSERHIRVMQKDHQVFELVGIDNLDYLDLYKKFSTKKDHENFKLNTITAYELGEKKVDFSEYSNLQKLYKNDFQKFIRYNIQDVELIRKLDTKLQLMKLSVMMAYNAKVNFQDVFSQVLMWDVIIFNYFLKHKLVVPPIKKDTSGSYPGAFVKEPIPGLYNWVVSYDLDSLYPNLIVQFNISPDTLIHKCGQLKDFSFEKVLSGDVDTDFLKSKQMTVAGNGQMFTIAKQGFLSSIIEPMYQERKAIKNKMLECEMMIEQIESELNRRNLAYK